MRTTLRELYVQGRLRMFPQLQKKLDQAQAYQRVLVTGQASPEECRMVLRDLMHAAQYLDVDSELCGDDALFRAGKRAMFSHILQRLAWSEGELLQLGQQTTIEEVAMHEAQRELELVA